LRHSSWDRTRVPQMTFEDMEQALRTRLEALSPAARAELVHVLRLPDFDRIDRIGEFWASPETRTFGELLIDLEEDQAARRSCSGCWRKWSGSSPESTAPRARAGARRPSHDAISTCGRRRYRSARSWSRRVRPPYAHTLGSRRRDSRRERQVRHPAPAIGRQPCAEATGAFSAENAGELCTY
jgi:hypothetical protein